MGRKICAPPGTRHLSPPSSGRFKGRYAPFAPLPMSNTNNIRRLVRSSLVTAGLGALVALALLTCGFFATTESSTFQLLANYLALLCPPWAIFWAGIGEPHNLGLWATVSAAVILANAALYVPIGLMYAATARLTASAVIVSVASAALSSLVLGHLVFTFYIG